MLFFVLFGAEPTCHKDLITIIQLLKKASKNSLSVFEWIEIR